GPQPNIQPRSACHGLQWIERARSHCPGGLKQGLDQTHKQRRLGELLLLSQGPDDLLGVRRYANLQYFGSNHGTHCVPTAAVRLSCKPPHVAQTRMLQASSSLSLLSSDRKSVV